MARSALITEDYRRMQQELHRNPAYGVASAKFAPLVADVMKKTGATEILDYGAGKGRLGFALEELFEHPLTIHHYDPAIPEWSGAPGPCDVVTCIDVLEQIEPDLLDNVLDDLRRVTAGVGVFSVHTEPTVKAMLDERNAHLIKEPPAWWLPKFMERFELTQFNRIPQGFYVIVERKPR